MKPFFSRILFVWVLFFTATVVRAEDLGVVRGRMEQRVSKIDALKTSGVLGEDNRGFLAVRSGSDDGVVSIENADRATVYAALAQKTGATADAVGKARARQIVAGSAAGVWLQRDSGEWFKK